MKKAFVLIAILVFAVTVSHAQDGWVTKKIDEKVSVKFPGEPKEIDNGIFLFIGKDSAVYISMVFKEKILDEIDSRKLTSDQIFEGFKKPEIEDKFKSMITKSFSNSKIEDFKDGAWNGLPSYNISGVITDSKASFYALIFIEVNTNMTVYIQFVGVPPGGIIKDKDDFLSSISLNN